MMKHMDYNALASPTNLEVTIKALTKKQYQVHKVPNGAGALAKIKEIVPTDASVISGTSYSLKQIGFTDLLKSGQHEWRNLQAEILAEKDIEKQRNLRRQASLADYYLGSVHALITNGEFIVASNTGNQLPSLVYNAKNLILVVSTKKIVATMDAGFDRLEKHVVPLENTRSQSAYGSDTSLNKIVIFKNENPYSGRKVHIILVEEDLGF
jgi:hypothetical protein